MSNSKLPDYSGTKNRAIAAFGWSRTVPGTERWTQAETLGRLAAENGFSVITGGYGGSMEAVSKGAGETIDAGKAVTKSGYPKPEVIGIVVSEVFPDRVTTGNKYLTTTLDSTSMMHRIDQLTTMSRYFVILPGTLGTLQELCSIWTLQTLHPKKLPQPVIIAFRHPWKKCMFELQETLDLPEEQLRPIIYVDSAEEAMEIILADDKAQHASGQ